MEMRLKAALAAGADKPGLKPEDRSDIIRQSSKEVQAFLAEKNRPAASDTQHVDIPQDSAIDRAMEQRREFEQQINEKNRQVQEAMARADQAARSALVARSQGRFEGPQSEESYLATEIVHRRRADILAKEKVLLSDQLKKTA